MKTVALVLAAVCTACAAPQTERDTRSPTTDYHEPLQSASDGQVVGADQVPPGDKLQQGPRLGPDGARDPHAKGEPKHHPPDPCKEVGLRDADGTSKCEEPSSDAESSKQR